MAYCPRCGSPHGDQDRFCGDCGAPLSSPEGVGGFEPTDTIGPYRLVGVIGSGGSGRVWLAYGNDGQPVAVKALSPSLVDRPGFIERFRLEAQTMAQLRHPHVVRLHDYLESSEGAWVVMEYVEGSSLRAVENHAHRLAPEQALGVLAGALSGLGYAHHLGLVHGDLKPENILVDTGGNSKLVDFGQVVTSGTTEPTLGGTPAYMSPESARGGPLDARSDLYSAGVVLYEALAGRPPFLATNDLALLRMQVQDEAPPIEHLPSPVDLLLRRSLAKEPEFRPQSADEFLSELETAARAGYGADWLQRTSVAALVAATTVTVASLAGSGAVTGAGATVGGTQVAGTTTATAGTTPVTGLAAPAPAGTATAAGSPASGVTAAPATTSSGLLAAHPVASIAAAVLLVGALAAGGLALTHRGSTTPTPSTVAVSATRVTFAGIEQTACAAIGAHDSQGDRCAILSMHVSTVSPQWVLVQGLGYYSGTDQPPSVQEAQSDLDDAILNLDTHQVIGPTNVGFCPSSGSDPDLAVVPTAVLAGWGLHPCTSGTSTSTTTAFPPATTAVPPTTAPHYTSLDIHRVVGQLGRPRAGTGHQRHWRWDPELCRPDRVSLVLVRGRPEGTMDFTLTSTNGNTASGTVTTSSDPKNYTVGTPVTVSLAAGSPGQILDVTVGGQGGGMYCNSTSAGQCGP